LTRDRDPAGRPRNARPRDALGRPLDRDGGSGSPSGPGPGSGSPSGPGPGSGSPSGPEPGSGSAAERIPDDLVIGGADAAALADRLLRDGHPFHAHEVLEAAWKTGPQEERDLWQGLAQIAVGLTHARRGNARGAVALLRRGAQRVRTYRPGPGTQDRPGTEPGRPRSDQPGPAPYGMDIPAVLARADDLAARIEQDGLNGILAADLAPRLMAADPELAPRNPASRSWIPADPVHAG